MWTRSLGLLATLALAAPAGRQDETSTQAEPTALIDLVDGSYKGFEGGLYPGSNSLPDPLRSAAERRAAKVRPRAADGTPDPDRGLIGLLSIGPSTAVHGFAAFERLEDPNPDRNPRVVLVNGCQARFLADAMLEPETAYWDLVLERVTAIGLTPEQVQVVWLSQFEALDRAAQTPESKQPGKRKDPEQRKRDRLLALEARGTHFPSEARALQTKLDEITTALAQRFENLSLIYLSDQPYGGHGDSSVIFNEPHIFETGFAVKWLIEEQLQPERDLDRGPLLLWGPYFWANGSRANSLGTRWDVEDFEPDNVGHPSPQGEAKISRLLRDFFHRAPSARPWYTAKQAAPVTVVDADRDVSISAVAPKRASGGEHQLRLGAGGTETAYIHFDLSGVQRPVLHAKLSLRVQPDPGSSFAWKVFQVADTWGENELTFANAPALGELAGVLPQASRDGTRALDLTDSVNHLERPSLAIAVVAAKRDRGLGGVMSRESEHPPRLILISTPDPESTDE